MNWLIKVREVEGMMDNMARNKDRNNGGLVVGIILVVFGLLFLAGQFLSIDLAHVFWPLFIIIPGLAFYVAMFLGGRNLAGFAIPGSVITTVGLILLVQNTFRIYQTWSYAWALIPTAVGFGLFVMSIWGEHPENRGAGLRLMKIGVSLFFAFGIFFEFLVGVSGFRPYSQWVLPALLIAFGVFLLVSRFADFARKQ
jgi:hypothetical protein